MHKNMKSSDKILLFFFLSFVVAGAVEGMAKVDSEWLSVFVMLHTLLIAILIFAWCSAHVAENKIIPPVGSRLLAALFPPFGVPYYMLAGYGFKKGGVRLLKSILFFVLCVGSYNGLFYVLQHAC